MQSRFNMFQSQLRVGIFNDIPRGFSIGKHFKNQINHDPGGFKARFTVTDIWIRNNVIEYAHGLSIPYCSFLSMID